jgi:DNA-binding CsgD family transcriptional regulator
VNHSTRSRTHAEVARLDSAKLDLPTLMAEASRLMAAALPYDAGCWHTMDPATMIETSFYIDDMPKPPGNEVAEFAYLTNDYNTFPKLTQGRRHSGVLTEATAGRLDRSTRYRELLRPLDIRGELRAALVVDGACWGCFAFFREDPMDFTADERDFAHDVASLLGNSFRAAGVRARMTGRVAALWPGLILIGEDRRVESITTPARKWLEELGFPGDVNHDPLPYALITVAERVRGNVGEASARVLGASGDWIQVLGSPALGGDPGRVAVILQAATIPSIAPLISAAYGLTARERELTDLVLRGCATAEIARRLFISPHTVQGHLKAIFAKTGVRSRRDLVSRVFAPHDRPPLD